MWHFVLREWQSRWWVHWIWQISIQTISFWWGSQGWSSSTSGLEFLSIPSSLWLLQVIASFFTSSLRTTASTSPCSSFFQCWPLQTSYYAQRVSPKHLVYFGWKLMKSHFLDASPNCSFSTSVFLWIQPFYWAWHLIVTWPFAPLWDTPVSWHLEQLSRSWWALLVTALVSFCLLFS